MVVAARRSVLVLLLIALSQLGLLPTAHLPPAHAEASAVARDVLSFMNRARADQGLPALALYSDASQAQRANNHFVATGQPHGRFQESADWYIARGATGFGENQAYSSNADRTAGWVVNEWLASPSHRDVMLNGDANYAVIAVSCSAAGMHVTGHVVTVPDGVRGPAAGGGGVSSDEGASCGGAAPPPPPPPPPPPAARQLPSTPPAQPSDPPSPPAERAAPLPPDESVAPPPLTPPVSPAPGERADKGLAPLEPREVVLAAVPAPPPLQQNATSSRDGSLMILAALLGGVVLVRRQRRGRRR